MVSNGFPNVTASCQQYDIGEKPSVIHCTLTTLISMQGHQNHIFFICLGGPDYSVCCVFSSHSFWTSRALSLRNLVSGYECRRVFPAGVGPGSPSRDAANWLPSRSDLSVETRRQYGWLRMVFSGVRLFRAPTWWPSGGWRHARGREHCRGEPGGCLSGGYAPDSAKAEGS